MAAQSNRKGRFIVVQWKSSKPIDIPQIATFVKGKSKASPEIRHGEVKNSALLIFDKEKDTEFLKEQWRDSDFWKITSLFAVVESNSLRVTNLPQCERREVHIFFNNPFMLGELSFADLDVDVNLFQPHAGSCVVHLTTVEDVKKACEKQKKFKKFKSHHQLKIEPFYGDIHGLQTEIEVEPLIIDNLNARKVAYLKDFYLDEITEDFKENFCTNIVWALDGLGKIKFEFQCSHDDHRVKRGREFPEKIKANCQEYFNKIVVDDRTFDQANSKDIKDVLDHYAGRNVYIEEMYSDNRVVLVGLEEEEELKQLQEKLNKIEPPRPRMTKSIPFEKHILPRLIAFKDLALYEAFEADSLDVTVDTDKITLTLTGVKEDVEKAETEIWAMLNRIVEHQFEFPDKAHKEILTTKLMTDKIQDCINDLGTRCGFTTVDGKITLYASAKVQLEQLEREILDLVSLEELEFEGKIVDKRTLEKKLKEIEENFKPYVKISYEMVTSLIKVKVVSGKDYLPLVVDKLEKEVDVLLQRREKIHMSPYILKYICDITAMASIKKELKGIKAVKIDPNVLSFNKKDENLYVEGVELVRRTVIDVVKTYAAKVFASWRNIQGPGIGTHCSSSNEEFVEILRATRKSHKCEFKIATKEEMKENRVHCIVILDSGQGLFVGTGSLTDPTLEVDVVVNPTNCDLKHMRKGLGRDLVEEGGRMIQSQCDHHIKTHGPLETSEVFISDAGKLPFQKIIHVAAPVWQGGAQGEEELVDKALENVLSTMNNDTKFILRSVATPLIGHGQGKFSSSRSARLMLQTIKNTYKKYPNVREIFFYDHNPATVRTIQQEMHAQFGDNCFHLPVEKVSLGKDTIGPTKKNLLCLRNGSRTLPMPGRKSLIIKWGKLEETGTEIVVCPTATAPKPSGKVLDAICSASPMAEAEAEKAFKQLSLNSIADGAIVETMGPVGNIYFLKIAEKWDGQTGRASLKTYVEKCLTKAIINKIKYIAMPPIGPISRGYPGDVVANEMIKTVAEFLQSKPNCCLEEVTIVIYESDMVTTSAFEYVLQSLYKHRPHRLESEIQEKVTEEKKSTDVEFGSGRVIVRNTAPPKGAFCVAKGINLELCRGSIEYAKTDAVVCTTSSFPNLHGAIADAIKKAGGTSLQRDLSNTYKSYPGKGTAFTSGGNLHCKKVYYVLLSDYDANNKNKNLTWKVQQCLMQAEHDKLSSIAMPTFGTGGFSFPDDIAAKQMFKAIKEFFQTPRTYLHTVVIFMYAAAANTCQVFETTVGQYFSLAAPDQAAANPPPPADKPDTEQGNMSIGKARVETIYGPIEQMAADVIMDTTTSFPKLNGTIPMLLAKAAGKEEFEAECKKRGNAKEGNIVITQGFKLKCKKVYHFVMPTWKQDTGEKSIHDCIKKCLTMMKADKYTTIAVPTIGTGGYHYDAALVAKGICSAAGEFGKANPDYDVTVKIILYPGGPQDANNAIKSVVSSWNSGSGNANIPKPKSGKKVGFQAAVDDVQDDEDSGAPFVPPKRKRDFVLLQFVSDKTKNVDEGFDYIKDQIDKDRRVAVVELKREDNIDDVELIENDKKGTRIEELADVFNVDVNVDLNGRKVTVKGMGEDVPKCFRKILEHLSDRRRDQLSRHIGQTVLKHIEWYYTEDSGKLWVPYPRHISFMLEEAFDEKVNEKKFTDSDKRVYVVDFRNWTECVHDGKKTDSTSAVTVIRKDLTEGSISALPGYWAPMADVDTLLEVPVLPAEEEYQKVEAAFIAALGAYRPRFQHIKEIRRIQNRSLWQQYMTRKQQLDAELAGRGVQDIERRLWHGYDVQNEKSINVYGFNRSYSGQTFGAVYYGLGVYFAVKSEYSAGASYSPVDAAGYKHVYQARVLVGDSVQVNKGYTDRYPPLLPGSQTDRYNSTCDDPANPGEFVIYSDTQAYPEYTIVFK
ncbi:protein mono-ADP-ribosyltransferase PARP14-like isoform X3 [Mya arenaria]|uniref:protein mono-ADP-ribosyltransferase PARP14-like isoform X3 n=1 Tax=Mya arenaria TaxID=6604 RepID=UPI0022E05A76|nr:protein mono-ADP-ribosyltransferase PARP14-like isoform X3 [Mya arenaria]